MEIKETLKNVYEKIGRPVTFFDCETTGLEIAKDDIIQIYIAKYDASGFSELNHYCNTLLNIHPNAEKKHGISKDSLSNKPYFNEVSIEVFEFFNGDSVICGYNHVTFDIPILIENLLRANVNKSVNLLKRDTIDVLIEYRKSQPNDLTSVFERITGENMGNAHEAQTDTYATSRILEEMLANNYINPTKSTRVDVDGFFTITEGGIAFAKGKHHGKVLKEMNHNDVISYLSWIGEKAENMSSHTRLVALTLRGKIQQTITPTQHAS